MQNAGSTIAKNDIPACLELLREADRLLDSAPRTARAELADAASERAPAAVFGGAVRGLVLAATQGFDGPGTPAADRELGEACRLLRRAATGLTQHPSGLFLVRSVDRFERESVETAAAELGAIVRGLHGNLRAEFRLLDVPPLTNWVESDPEDEAVLRAAGLGAGRRALTVALVVLAVAALYVFIFSR